MLPESKKIKGIHPGAILKRELQKRKIKSIELAKSIGEYPQTINAVLKERRGINPKLSIKLGKFFGVDNDYFMILQASYEVNLIEKANMYFDVSLSGKVRKAIFWDTDFDKIDWNKNRKVIIKRILERGNENEIQEAIKFYGLETIKKQIKSTKNSFFHSYNENIQKYVKTKVN